MRKLIGMTLTALSLLSWTSSKALAAYGCGGGFTAETVLFNVGSGFDGANTAIHAARIGCNLYVSFVNVNRPSRADGVYVLDMCAFNPTSPYDAATAPFLAGQGFDSRHALQVVTNNPTPVPGEPVVELWVTDKLNGQIKRIDQATGTVLQTINTKGVPDGLAHSPLRGYTITAAVNLGGSAEITEFDLKTGAVVSVLATLAGFNDHMAWEAGQGSARFLYIAQQGGITKLDASNGSSCVLAGGLGADGVAFLGSCGASGTVTPQVWANTNGGAVLQFLSTACPTAPTSVCSDATRGDGIAAPLDGFLYPCSSNGVSRIGSGSFTMPGGSPQANLCASFPPTACYNNNGTQKLLEAALNALLAELVKPAGDPTRNPCSLLTGGGYLSGFIHGNNDPFTCPGMAASLRAELKNLAVIEGCP